MKSKDMSNVSKRVKSATRNWVICNGNVIFQNKDILYLLIVRPGELTKIFRRKCEFVYSLNNILT